MITYKDSGVDIEKGNEFVRQIKPIVQKTFSPLVLGTLGSFSGAIRLPAGYKEPAILGATDGVGSKLKFAIEANNLSGIGIDLVAMCVNDLICNFAKPLFFLDYYATAKLEINKATQIIKSIAKGCEIAKCSLIGGETAEMPSVYSDGDFDLAGFSVGIAEVSEIDRSKFIKNGDILIALVSSGFHSNGYSLLRNFVKKTNLNLNEKFQDTTLIEAILKPTKIYVNEFLDNKEDINALAHITGGGLFENLIRVFPKNLKPNIDFSAIKIPEIFEILNGYVSNEEMSRTFNMGVGMVLVSDKNKADKLIDKTGGYVIGEVSEIN